MSITQFKNTATLQLDESNPVAVPLGEPIAIASTTSVERDVRGFGALGTSGSLIFGKAFSRLRRRRF